jgi:hypothetical protein
LETSVPRPSLTSTPEGRRARWGAWILLGLLLTGCGDGPITSFDEGFAARCWAELPPSPGPLMQVHTKLSDDGRTRVRLALYNLPGVPSDFGVDWFLVRFSYERDTVRVCVREPEALAYHKTVHNCGDTAAATAGGVRYQLRAPSDSVTDVSAFAGQRRLWGPVRLHDATCTPEPPQGICIVPGRPGDC